MKDYYTKLQEEKEQKRDKKIKEERDEKNRLQREQIQKENDRISAKTKAKEKQAGGLLGFL